MGKYYCKICKEQEGICYFLDDKTCPNCNRKVIYLPKAKLSHLRGHSISRFKNEFGVSIGGMQNSNNAQDNWKPSVYQKTLKEEKPKVGISKDESNDIQIEIHDGKKTYQMIIEKATKHQIKDDILILSKNESEKEIVLPKNVKSETAEVTEKNGILTIVFQKKIKRRNKCQRE